MEQSTSRVTSLGGGNRLLRLIRLMRTFIVQEELPKDPLLLHGVVAQMPAYLKHVFILMVSLT